MASANTTGHYSPELAETRPLLVNASEPDRFTIHKTIMNQRYTMFQRAGVFYCEDTTTGKQLSLRTKNEAEALTLLHSKNESVRQPKLNLQIAKTYLAAADESFIKRTWREVMAEFVRTKSGNNRIRTERAVMDKSFDTIRDLQLIETRSEHFCGYSNPTKSRPTIICAAFTISPWTWAGYHGRCCPRNDGRQSTIKKKGSSPWTNTRRFLRGKQILKYDLS